MLVLELGIPKVFCCVMALILSDMPSGVGWGLGEHMHISSLASPSGA